jgi:hypothetical protein
LSRPSELDQLEGSALSPVIHLTRRHDIAGIEKLPVASIEVTSIEVVNDERRGHDGTANDSRPRPVGGGTLQPARRARESRATKSSATKVGRGVTIG